MIRFTLTGQADLAAALRALPEALRRETVLDVLTIANRCAVKWGRSRRAAPTRAPGRQHADPGGEEARGGGADRARGRRRRRPVEGLLLRPLLGYRWSAIRRPSFMRPAFDGAQAALDEIGRGLWAAIAPAAGTSGRHL